MSKDLVPFHGDTLVAEARPNSDPIVAIRLMVESAGLDWSSQLKRIKRDEILSRSMVVMTIETPAGPRETQGLPLGLIPGFWMGVSARRITDEDLRNRVVTYQMECYRVLYSHFMGRKTRRQADPIIERAKAFASVMREVNRAGDKPLAQAVARHYAAELGIVAASAHTAASDGGPVVTLQGRVRPLVMAFLAERTRPVARGLVGATDLYNAFLAWLEDQGEPAVTHRAAGDAFRLSGLKKGRGRVVVYLGIELVAKAPPPPSGMAE